MSHLMDTILALGTRTTVQGGSGTTAQPSRYNFTWDHPVNSHCVPSGGRSPTPRPKEAMAMLYVSCLTRPSRRKFYTRIYRNRDAISKLVAHHLSIYPSACQVEVEEPKKWMSGSFNLCVPVNVNTFTTHFIEEADGRMLSDDWRDKHDDDQTLRMNLFRNLAKIILTLSHRPLPKIGSFTIDNDGFLRLENRPLAAAKSTIVENEETPLDIPRDRVYPTVDSDVNGILSVHDSYLRYQPNSLACVADCVTQMSALSMMRALSARFLEPGLNHGPFYLSLTDLHASNILIDDDWNIKYLIDLEWAICATIGILAAALLANWRDWG
ncbi:uncharacterized protein BDCG_01407 [Blastomyces dermatitidis ER-3]|uniref:Aminoglycoside phosphotransferase domain-containing protein n=1 Tax=Ajellomyces dermatitidis (strain ER-3 / ATCC MYA-2586) TaxID=559297 RepID=A0ABP2ERI1_AJEDR|nr:uncharacterized protein BDCG_01407 [Blastomyces dermatitidis ER-3]EEQ86287.2 hypothetical protein BDCG_01407 [Blastomyces dermatitidis ER-3]